MPNVLFTQHCSTHVSDTFSVRTELQRLSGALGKDIIFEAPHGVPVYETFPEDSVNFYIYLWGTPHQIGYQRGMPKDIWGVSTLSLINDSCFMFSGTGIDIADGNFSVAELVNYNQLFILFDLLHYRGPDAISILSRLVDEVIALVKNSK